MNAFAESLGLSSDRQPVNMPLLRTFALGAIVGSRVPQVSGRR